MQELLTGKLRLPWFSGKWEVKKLGELLDYEQPTKYLVKDTEYSDNYNIPVLTAGKTFVLGYTNEETGIFKDLPVIIFRSAIDSYPLPLPTGPGSELPGLF